MRSLLKQKIVVLSLVLTSFSVWAGEATFIGYGSAQVPPEFVTVTVKVTSECFASARAASSANDDVANQVLTLLKNVAITSAGDVVSASGGLVKRYTGYNSQLNKAICINTFRKVNQLTLKTHTIKEFPQMFAMLQDKIYALGMSTDVGNIEKPTNFLEINEPDADLTPETRKTYDKITLAMALQDAKEKFEATLVLAGIKSYKIVNYSENVKQREFHSGERKAIGDANSSPVEFGNINVEKSLNVRFEFVGGDLNIL